MFESLSDFSIWERPEKGAAKKPYLKPFSRNWSIISFVVRQRNS